ncbi:Lytic murein transglycosylase [Rhodopseudomonas palustris HaA2]|uniref:Lytic murein transglycosylase n=1 Tax=Rhodopseudomonas palustris (strain HaA2) TaxID=316058 RepID=Q2IVV0_RHOP2|nr:lytic murein transglycosylase [Rhodopseudomonas palustris]ABD07660.1 Lytic murein transglycosylase [Rhodopseudomonas palustris HaA2]
MASFDSRFTPTRRRLLQTALGAAVMWPAIARAAPAGFDAWRDGFRSRALAKGITPQTWDRAMARLEPDMSVFKNFQKQPEFHEQLWQYINRRVSDWRITNGRLALQKTEPLFARIERDFGVERGTLLALWGVESAYGDPLVQQNHMRPVFPSLAALAWNEPRRKAYWETELINALRIVDRGWSTPEEMRGSWAGAMGHTQWMPEVWLNVGIDYDRDGRVSPFGRPDDALGSSAKYLVNRGKYRRGEHWGYEVRGPGGAISGSRSYLAWSRSGVSRVDGEPFPDPQAMAQMWVPVAGGPQFLLGPNFYAVRSYNPSMNYALAICHLGDRILGAGPFANPFPGSERAMTLAEVQEMQTRLTRAGFDTGGTDGRVGNDTMKAVRDYQARAGMQPADGYGGLKLLARLRQGP